MLELYVNNKKIRKFDSVCVALFHAMAYANEQKNEACKKHLKMILNSPNYFEALNKFNNSNYGIHFELK